ncbi:hypothetical protein EJB05_27964, partial [Eragrostis curvula]
MSASAQETAAGNPPGGCLRELVLATGGAAHLGLLDGDGSVPGSVRCRRSETEERAQVPAQIQAERLGGSIGTPHARGMHPVTDSQLGFVFIAHLLEAHKEGPNQARTKLFFRLTEELG